MKNTNLNIRISQEDKMILLMESVKKKQNLSKTIRHKLLGEYDSKED